MKGADDCLNWEQFANDLDIVMAHIIEAANSKTPPEDYRPSEITGIKIMSFVNQVVLRNAEAAKAEAKRLEDIANDVATDAKEQEDGKFGYDFDSRAYRGGSDKLEKDENGKYIKLRDRPGYKACKWCGLRLNSDTISTNYHPMCLVQKLNVEATRGGKG